MSSLTFRKPRSVGFTIVELLVVIAIIGVLAGILIPAIGGAVKTSQIKAHRLEVDTIADAVEKYRTKYGDYPPDGSSWPIMERHLRKAFPQILQSELNLLDPGNPNGQGWNGNATTLANGWIAGVRNDFAPSSSRVMDPAEALVFFLGGFSNNPQKPFTGDGGPFIATGATSGQLIQYNPARTGGFYEFKTNRLSLTVQNFSGGQANISNDEVEYHGIAPDLLPVYLANSDDVTGTAPMVYFDSRTYWVQSGNAYVANYYQAARVNATTASGGTLGSIRPLVSQEQRLPPDTSTPFRRPPRNRFVEEGKFQVISPGIDGAFGGSLLADSGFNWQQTTWMYPSGYSFTAQGNSSDFEMFHVSRTAPSEIYRASLNAEDNCGNFSGDTFKTSLP